MSIEFNEALENNILESFLLKNIPRKCKCGSDIVFSDSLRNAHCNKYNCVGNVINRVAYINKKLKLNISDIDIENIVNKLKLTTPYQVFMLDVVVKHKTINHSDIHNLDEVLDNLDRVKKEQYYLYEVIEMSGLDYLTNIAKTLFNGFDSVAEAYNEIDKGQLSFISNRLGLVTTEASAIGVEIYNQLVEYMEEFLFAEMQLKIKRYSDNKLNIAFCDNVFPFVNRQEYIEYLNSLTKFKFNLIHSVSNNTDILVRNSFDNSSKSRSARIINDKFIADEVNSGRLELSEVGKFKDNDVKPIGSIIYICTSDELIDRLKELEV